MAMNHAILDGSSTMYWDNDALNMAGVCATVDLDNGQLVTLKQINREANGDVKGFEYEVEPATAGADNVWIVASPEVGYDLESQLHDDPRYFYNPKGKAMSVKALMSGVDVIKVTKEVFTSGNLPTQANLGQYIAPDANGKYADAVAVAPAQGAYFRVEGFGTFTCGFEEVPAVYLRCMANYH
ncbi:MAG TPA: hypothetical protein DCW90_14720 [Lachnospiraceae bacterium]|nr:hypothetical protein [Lachnospiraceae bacterium]